MSSRQEALYQAQSRAHEAAHSGQEQDTGDVSESMQRVSVEHSAPQSGGSDMKTAGDARHRESLNSENRKFSDPSDQVKGIGSSSS